MRFINILRSLEFLLLYIIPITLIVLFITHNFNLEFAFIYIALLFITLIFAIFSNLARQHIIVSIGITILFSIISLFIFVFLKYIYPKFFLILHGKYHLILIYIPILTGMFGFLWGAIPPLIIGYFKSIYFALRLKRFTYNPISITFYNGIITMIFLFGISLVFVIYITPLWYLSKIGFITSISH